MAFDLATAQPFSPRPPPGFDLASARPVGTPPAQSSGEQPLTFGSTLAGEGELLASGIANIPHAALHAGVDLFRRLTGGNTDAPDPSFVQHTEVPVGEAGRNLVRGVAELPPVQAAVRAAQAGDEFLGRVSPTLQDVVHQAAHVGGDVASLTPVGGAAMRIEGAVVDALAGRAARAAIPTTEELGNAASAAYRRAEQAGVVVTPQNVEQLKGRVAGALSGDIVDPTLHPKTSAVLARIANTEGPQSLGELDALRRVARDARKGATPDDSRLLGKVVDAIDDHVEALRPSDVAAGNATDAVQALQDARNLYSRNRKADTIEQLVDRAGTRAGQFSGSGFENALRTEFRQLALNQKRMRTFTAEEQAAIKRVARGGPIDNLARYFGKFAPRGIVSTALGMGVGAALHGPMGAAEGGGLAALSVPALGEAARHIATRRTLGNVERLSQIIRRGPPGSAPLSRPVADSLGSRVVPPETPAAPPPPPRALPAPGMLGNARGTLAREQQLTELGLTPDVASAGAAHPGSERLLEVPPEPAPPPPAALPAPGQVAIQLSSDEAQARSLADALGLTADVRRAGAAHPGVARVAPPRAPLALPAPTRGPVVVDQAGRAAPSAEELAAHRRELGVDELGPGVRQPAAGANPEREAAASQATQRASQGVSLTGREITQSPGENIATLKQKAHAYAQGNFADKTVTNRSDGSQILITKAGIDHAFSGRVSRKAALATAQLDRILENGKLVSTEADKEGRQGIRAVHQYDTPITIAGKPATIRSVVREHADGRRYYDHFEVRPDGSSGSRETSGASPAAGADRALRLGSEARPTAINVGTEDSTAGARKTLARTGPQFSQRTEAAPDRAAFLRKFTQLSEESPTNPAGRLFTRNVSVELVPEPTDEHTVHIEDLRALTTGKGYGAKALEKLTALADRNGVRLTLDAHPLDRGGISKEKLIQFYERAGFRPEPDDFRPNLMVREPGGAAVTPK